MDGCKENVTGDVCERLDREGVEKFADPAVISSARCGNSFQTS
jgi:hypothetical protein